MSDTGALDPLAIARRIADELESAGAPYAIGGALAYGYWGPPRGTVDVDIDVFPGTAGVEIMLDALERAGVTFDRHQARSRIHDRGDFQGHHRGMRVDVFVAFDEYHEAVLAHRARVEMLGRPAWILSAEDTVIFKVLFDRPKDWVDLERLVALRAGTLDVPYLERWLSHWLGELDPCRLRLRELLARHVPAP